MGQNIINKKIQTNINSLEVDKSIKCKNGDILSINDIEKRYKKYENEYIKYPIDYICGKDKVPNLGSGTIIDDVDCIPKEIWIACSDEPPINESPYTFEEYFPKDHPIWLGARYNVEGGAPTDPISNDPIWYILPDNSYDIMSDAEPCCMCDGGHACLPECCNHGPNCCPPTYVA